MFFKGEYYFLLNMFPCRITFNGFVFVNAEAAFQAQKTIEREVQKQFCKLKGKDAKRKGRKIQLRSNWEAIILKNNLDF